MNSSARLSAYCLLPILIALCAGCGNGKAPDSSASSPSPAPVAADSAPVAVPTHAGPLSPTVAAHTPVLVDLLEVVDSEVSPKGIFIRGVVSQDTNGPDGKLAIPAGSQAILVIADKGRTGSIARIVLGLHSIDIEGRQHVLARGDHYPATALFTEDAGKGAGHTGIHLLDHERLKFVPEQALDLH